MGRFVTLTKTTFKAGIIKDDTQLAAEGGYVASDKVRFRRGSPEALGGWQLLSTETFQGIARGAHDWTDLNGNPLLAWGTAGKLYALVGGAQMDITPPLAEGVLQNPFTTVSGSNVVTVTSPLHGLATGNTVTFTNGTTVGGLTLDGTYTVSVVNQNSYTITAGSNATSSVTAGVTQTATRTQGTNVKNLNNPFSTVSGSTTVTVSDPAHGFANGVSVTFSNAPTVAGINFNNTYTIANVTTNTYTITAASAANATVTPGNTGTVDYVAPFVAGNVDGLGIGYGSGTYGSGPYGATTITDTEPRIWSLDNFGERLQAVPRDGSLYEWQPSFQALELALNGGFDTTANWATGTGWSISGGVATKTAGTPSALSQNIVNAVTAGKVYRVTFTATVTAGTLKFQVNAGSPTAALIDVNGSAGAGASTPITRSGTYTRTFRMPANPVDMVFYGDAAFAGTIDNVSFKLESRAYRIDEAPRNIGWMFVDPNRFVVLLATQQADGVYNPLLVRWSGQENNRIWIPDTGTNANLAGELALSIGGTALSGLAARQQNLLWTESALYGMVFTGSADTVFSFKPLGSGCGIIGRNAAVEHNGIAFWMSPAGFYIFQGATPQKIDSSVEKDVFANISALQAEKIYAGVNPNLPEVVFLYPDARDGVECSRAVRFNYIEQHWAVDTFDRSCMVSQGVFPNLIMFGNGGLIFEHEVGQTANGNPIVGYLETSYFDVEDGGNLMNIMRIVPDFLNQAGPVSFTIKGRPFPNGPEWTWGPYTYGTGPTAKQKLDMRRTARQMKIRMDFASAPAAWRLGALRIDAQKSGAIR